MKNFLSWSLIGLVLSAAVALTGGTPAAGGSPHTQAVWPDIDLAPVAEGLVSPVHVTHAGDGSGRLFVVEQAGRIRIVENGELAGVFLDIREQVRSPDSGGGSEEGLLSVAFPPGYAEKGHFYVYYTNAAGNNVLSRFHTSAAPDQADPGSEEIILLLEHPEHTNHNGGQLAFGPDGYLYVGTGDGGGGGDPEGNAQDPASLLGKLLRIDVEIEPAGPVTGEHLLRLPVIFNSGQAGPTQPRTYWIPPDNPFRDEPDYRPEIWALGLRNPWRFSFDRQTGDLYIGDVGQGKREEVDFQPGNSAGGENYGWNYYEGTLVFEGPPPQDAAFIFPIFEYDHIEENCSVTGGMVYRGASFPGMQGIFFLADYCSGRIWGLRPEGQDWAARELLQTEYRITSFGEDEAGELYLVDRSGGGLYQIRAAASSR